MSYFKLFTGIEGQTLQFRSEFFDTLNHSQSAYTRVIQLALK